jgi:hypothetical protein
LGVAIVGESADASRIFPPGSAHRLVTIGDSLTHGFKSLAIADTELSWPSILARTLGFDFRMPCFDGPPVCPGLPLNLEAMLRALEAHHNGRLDLLGLPIWAGTFLGLMKQVDTYWDKGPGFFTPSQQVFNDNLGIYGWDLRDALSSSRGLLEQEVRDRPPAVSYLRPGVRDNGQISALRVLAGPGGDDVTQLSAAKDIGAEGAGIETLVVMLGANNALGAVTCLGAPKWSDTDYDDHIVKRNYTVWRPDHFAAEYALVVEQLKQIRAHNVILSTVPHVTVCPLARGVYSRPPGSRYFPFYTRPWLTDDEFDPGRDPYLTSDDAWAIDSAIDDYNDAIKEHVRAARRDGRRWYLFDLCGLLDRLAYRRYLADPSARPEGFEPYQLPAALAELDPPPDTRFFSSDNGVRSQGGLIALDGVHPTTAGYAIVAAEVLRILELAGIPEAKGKEIDFAWIAEADTLLARPPLSLGRDLRLLGHFQELADWVAVLRHAVA